MQSDKSGSKSERLGNQPIRTVRAGKGGGRGCLCEEQGQTRLVLCPSLPTSKGL